MSKEQYIANKNLKELHGSGFEVAKGEPDIRGWKVKDLANNVIGKVDDLLFDTVSLRVRYLVIKLDGKPINLISRPLLIPIGLAELNEKDDVVIFPDVTVGHLASLPEYKKGEVSVQTERAIRTVFADIENRPATNGYYDDDEFYNHSNFNEDKVYRPQRSVSENQYNKRIIPSKNKPEEESKDLHNNIEGGFAPFQEGKIEFVEHTEVPVVLKEARVVEEISVNKEITERNKKVKDSVRKTDVDIEKLNKNDIDENIEPIR